jgi:hypothetical protein
MISIGKEVVDAPMEYDSLSTNMHTNKNIQKFRTALSSDVLDAHHNSKDSLTN